MDKFWEWMEKKGYGDMDVDTKRLYEKDAHKHVFKGVIDPTKQMLIGYMYEYIDSFYQYENRASTDEIYKHYEQLIKEAKWIKQT